MPELPEVETIVRKLRHGTDGPSLVGQTIERVTVQWPRHVAVPDSKTFQSEISGRTIKAVDRRGKYLVMSLDRGWLLIHLKMTGDLLMSPAGQEPGPYDHTIFHFASEWELRFSDARKFGKVYLVDDVKQITGKLGPEPLGDEFTVQGFAERLQSRKRILKPLLMDQNFLAGIGNIYADEALHLAGIHPRRRSHQLTKREITRLWEGIQQVLTRGIRHNGASLDWVYRGGDFQNHFRVYQKAGEPCLKCGSQIERIVVGQRGTHFCPTCQPEVSDGS
jgi:formamidopyrimidine-DNA glycosylase